MITKCPHCKKSVELPDEQAGDMSECPQCGNLFKAPIPEYLPKCCPVCRTPLEGIDKICLECGYNFATKQRLETHIITPSQIHPWWLQPLYFLADCLPGLFRPATLIAFIICAALSIATAVLSLSIMSMGAILSGFGIAVAGMMIYIHGVAFLAVGSIIDLKNAMVELHGRSMEAFFWLTATPPLLILIAMYILSKNNDL